MNKRTRELLRELTASKKSVSAAEMAKKFHVSERTIRSDIAEINEFLHKNGYHKISVLKGGVILPGSDIEEVLNLKMEQDIYSYRLSKDERINIASMLLINAVPSVTISDLSRHLQVSRATVTNEMDEIKEALVRRGCRVVTYSNKGLCVKGSELQKRIALYQIIWSLADVTHVDDIRFPHYPGLDLNDAIKPSRRRALCQIINEEEHLFQTFFTDESFARLQCYIITVMLRLGLGALLEPQPLESEIRYPFAYGLMERISQYCGFAMSEDEIRALSSFLDTLRYSKKKADPEIIRIQMVTRRFITAVSETLNIGLTGDLEFYQDLSNHLTSILKNKEFVDENPLISQIATEHPNIYRVVQAHKHILEECCGRTLNRIEQEYIVIHICVAIERITNHQRELSVALVCGSGIATSRLLYEKLSRHFNIIALFSSHDAAGIQKCGADLIVSTVPLQMDQIETVVVSAMLTPEDMLRVFAKADEIRRRWDRLLKPENGPPTHYPRQLLRSLQSIIESETGRTDTRLYRRITESVMDYFDLSEASKDTLLLRHLLSPELIRMDVVCGDWREAVYQSARPLLKQGYIDPIYVDRVFELIEENGAYMVMAKELIVLHANYQDGSHKIGLSLLRLRHPLDFGAEDYQKQIRYVCCLSPVDSFGHLQALMNLTNLFGDADFCAEAAQAASSSDLYNVICRHEKNMQ